MKKWMVRMVAVVSLLVLGLGGALAWHRHGPRTTPDGQPPLRHLDAASLGAFKQEFNAASAKTRVLVTFSPT